MEANKIKQIKSELHSRNRNGERYDLNALIISNPELKGYLLENKQGKLSIDFSDPVAVKALNQALLNYYYGIKNWNFPNENLCPPIPGRADYLHYMADLLAESNGGVIPIGNKIKCLDIGTGASCIYPIIGVVEYDWSFIATDIDSHSIASAQNIIKSNDMLGGKIECRLQTNSNYIFENIINNNDRIDITMSNPPFHRSKAEAKKVSKRKVKNLKVDSKNQEKLNFSGNSNELICRGGEAQFIKNMIFESEQFTSNCRWFSTLVSKQSNLKEIYRHLKKVGSTNVKTIPMGTGNKTTRIVAWSYER
ncbi:MAG: 23S rRNA (adenine(1618)-N(6))-methyltransferase RlmF [Crocinitomicaceae bacterium]